MYGGEPGGLFLLTCQEMHVFREGDCPQFLSCQELQTVHTSAWLLVGQTNKVGS